MSGSKRCKALVTAYVAGGEVVSRCSKRARPGEGTCAAHRGAKQVSS